MIIAHSVNISTTYVEVTYSYFNKILTIWGLKLS
jgi:hypothetical protein